ncbi:MAG TPA: collagen-like protein, partial [Bacteroidia bacterium]|nr:collagen-like protein [Bacteroidia bacterium]
LDDGSEMLTKGLSQGKVKWGNYIVNVVGGTFNDGDVTINDDPRKIKDYKIIVTAKLLFDSSKTQTMEFVLDFKANYTADFSGRQGDDAAWASKGQSGATGSNNSKGDGGPGQKGQRGEDGRKGGNGQNGDAVDVYVSAFPDASGKTMLRVYVKSRSSSREGFYIVNPDGGSITILARGGRGGQGGHGGDGGGGGYGGNGHSRGGDSGDTFYGTGGTGGDGGDGGNGGDGGDGGNGGSITIFVDPSASAYVSVIKFDTSGGERGIAGSAGTGQGPGGGGDADTHGQTGHNGHDGKAGIQGQQGQSGPKPLVITQKVNIDWNTVATGN